MATPVEVRPWSDALALKCVGIYYHPRAESAGDLAEEIGQRLAGMGLRYWTRPALPNLPAEPALEETGLVISLGGDGTILRAAHSVLAYGIPILAINYGRLGFLAELTLQEARDLLPELLRPDKWWIEERNMIESSLDPAVDSYPGPAPALNDVVVARGNVGRPVTVDVEVDGTPVISYRGDAVIVATATGSTAYSLSAGGPILPPDAQEMVITPVAAHLTLSNSIVLPASARVVLRVWTDHPAAYSVDGQGDAFLQDGHRVIVQQSRRRTRFLRRYPMTYFYQALRRQSILQVENSSRHEVRP
jgi:NAD+ kinase